MTLLTENIPKCHGTRFVPDAFDAEHFVSFLDLRIATALLADTGKVTFYVSHEDRDAALAKAFGKALQRNRFASTRRSGYYTMAICHVRKQKEFASVLFCCKYWFCHAVAFA
jgi:hypothetical protein